jgi:hypothetical protein
MQQPNPYTPPTAEVTPARLKRPASVTSAIVVLSLLVLANLLTVSMAVSRSAYLSAIAAAAILALHIAPLVGLVTRSNWARVLGAVLLSLWAVLLIGNGAMSLSKQHNPITLIYGCILGGLLAWLIASLLSKEVKAYFSE